MTKYRDYGSHIIEISDGPGGGERKKRTVVSREMRYAGYKPTGDDIIEGSKEHKKILRYAISENTQKDVSLTTVDSTAQTMEESMVEKISERRRAEIDRRAKEFDDNPDVHEAPTKWGRGWDPEEAREEWQRSGQTADYLFKPKPKRLKKSISDGVQHVNNDARELDDDEAARRIRDRKRRAERAGDEYKATDMEKGGYGSGRHRRYLDYGSHMIDTQHESGQRRKIAIVSQGMRDAGYEPNGDNVIEGSEEHKKMLANSTTHHYKKFPSIDLKKIKEMERILEKGDVNVEEHKKEIRKSSGITLEKVAAMEDILKAADGGSPKDWRNTPRGKLEIENMKRKEREKGKLKKYSHCFDNKSSL